MRITLPRTVGTAMAALALLSSAGEALAQYGPGVGADQLVLRDPATGNLFVLRAPSTAGAPANYTLEFPNMTGVPSVAGVLMMIDNTAGPSKKVTLLPPSPNSVLITETGPPFYSTTLPGGLTIPTATITNPTITGGTMNGTAVTGGSINNTPIGNTTPSTGVFTNLNSTGNTTIGTGAGSTTTVGNSSGTTTIDGQTINVGHAGGTTNLNGTVNFSTPPNIPLAQNNIWVGNGSGRQQAYPPSPNSVLVTNNVAGGTPSWSTTLPGGLTIPGATITGGTINNTPIGNTTPSTGVFTNLNSTGNTAVGTGAGSATAVGNNTGTTNVQGSTVNLGTSDGTPGAAGETTNNIGYNDGDGAGPSGPSTTNINGNTNIGSNTGNNGGPTTTTINGNVIFANSPQIPLAQNAIFVGNASNIAAPYNSTGVNGAVLAQNATGTPTWTSATNLTSTTGSAPVTNINNGDVNNGSGTESVTNIGYNDPDGASPANGPSQTNINGNTNIGSSTGNNGGPTNTTINGNVSFNGNVTLPLTQNNIFVGNASNQAQAYPPGTNGSVLTVVGSTPSWSTTNNLTTTAPAAGGAVTNINTGDVNSGNNNEATTNIGYNDPDGATPTNSASTTNINGNTNIGSSTGNNGGPTTTTINGNVVFNTAPSIPLAQNAIFVGNASNVAAPVNSTNVPGAVLVQNATGTPTWSTAAMLTSTAGTAPQTNINTTDINNGSGTESNITIGYTDPDGSSASNGPSTTNIRGDVNLNTVNPNRNTPQTTTIGYNDPDGAGPNVASQTIINGNVTVGNPANFRNALGLYNGTLTISGSNTVFSGGRWITTVPQTAVQAGSQIIVTWDDNTTNFPSYKVSGRTAGASFTIDWSANPSSGNVHYFIINP